MEKKLNEMQAENADYIRQLIDMKEKQALAFNQVNAIYEEAKNLKASQLKEESKEGLFQPYKIDNLNPTYMLGQVPDLGSVPSEVEWKQKGHEGEVTTLSFNTVGDMLVSGG